MPLGLLGKKLGQTRVYDAKGIITPVTIVLAGPNRVLQCKTQQTDGYNAVQLGFNDQKEQRLTKPLLGHIKKFNGVAVKRIREFRNFNKEVKPGDVLGANLFTHEMNEYRQQDGYDEDRENRRVNKCQPIFCKMGCAERPKEQNTVRLADIQKKMQALRKKRQNENGGEGEPAL